LVECKRCWKCCISSFYNIFYTELIDFWNKKLPFNVLFISNISKEEIKKRLNTDWWGEGLKQPMVIYCPMLSVNGKEEPNCLIYYKKPKVCDDYLCRELIERE